MTERRRPAGEDGAKRSRAGVGNKLDRIMSAPVDTATHHADLGGAA